MKTILTILITLGALATVHAQSREETRRIILGERTDDRSPDTRNDRDVVLGRNDNGRYAGNRQQEIDQVNREYDNKITSIRNNRHLDRQEKDRTIRQLEQDRQRRLADINRRYNGYDRDNRNDRDDRYVRNGNGKKKGWEKGRGNPHGNGWKNKKWKNDRHDRD
jgi:hypothetical protein